MKPRTFSSSCNEVRLVLYASLPSVPNFYVTWLHEISVMVILIAVTSLIVWSVSCLRVKLLETKAYGKGNKKTTYLLNVCNGFDISNLVSLLIGDMEYCLIKEKVNLSLYSLPRERVKGIRSYLFSVMVNCTSDSLQVAKYGRSNRN